MTLNRKYNFIFLTLCLGACLRSSAADNPQRQFKEAGAAYAKGQFTKAAQLYQRIADQGYASAALYYNLGNAYYKTDQVPFAILYFEKAKKLAPGDEDVQFNLNFANQKATDKIENPTDFMTLNGKLYALIFWPLPLIATLSTLLFSGGFLILLVYLFAGPLRNKRIAFFSGITCIFFGTCVFTLGIFQWSYLNAHHEAIVFSNAVTIKSAPNDQSKDLFVLHDGSKVRIVEENEGWIRIKLPSGNSGWMAASSVKTI